MKLFIFVLPLLTLPAFAHDPQPLYAEVAAPQCAGSGDWTSEPHRRLRAALHDLAMQRCPPGTAPGLSYLYETVACRNSMLSASARFRCWW